MGMWARGGGGGIVKPGEVRQPKGTGRRGKEGMKEPRAGLQK